MTVELLAPSRAAASFTTLPTELLVQIILYLHWREILRLQTVRRFTHS